MKKMNRTAVECDWLREFDVLIDRPDVTDRQKRLWDWLPQDWTQDERFYQYDHWYENERLQQSDAKGYYDYVTGKFDKLLAEHGYVREGHYYRVEKPNEDTLVFFCHFGLECVLLAHLIGASPMVLWHGFCAAPSSVTTVIQKNEEKESQVFVLVHLVIFPIYMCMVNHLHLPQDSVKCTVIRMSATID